MSDLELFQQPSTDEPDLGFLVLRAAQSSTLLSIMKDLDRGVRDQLHDALATEQDRTGTTGFTAKVDGITGVLTDPQPKVRVTDPDAFADWATSYTDLEGRYAYRVEIHDHGKAAELHRLTVTKAGNRADLALLADDSMTVHIDTVLPDDAVDQLVARGIVKVDRDGAWWLNGETGEKAHVPGLAVSVAKQTPQVRPSKDAKVRLRRQIVDSLGIRELVDGQEGDR